MWFCWDLSITAVMSIFDDESIAPEDEFDRGTSTTESLLGSDDVEMERNEIEEVQKLSRKDTRRIRLWRVVIFSVLVATAAAVTMTTYKLLKNEQVKSFETGVSDILCC